MKAIQEFIETFGITEDEALRALISVFTPCNPGSVRQGWRRTSEYESAPETKEIWQLIADADFRCDLCKSQYRITIDHKDGDKNNTRIENLRVLCTTCNREHNSQGIKNRHLTLTIYRAAMDLYRETGKFPSKAEIVARAGLVAHECSSTIYLIRFLQARLSTMQPVRHYRPTAAKQYFETQGNT